MTIAVFDARQILQANQWWETPISETVPHEKYSEIKLVNQIRMTAGESTLDWLDRLTIDGKVDVIRPDEKNYDLRIFDTPDDLRADQRT